MQLCILQISPADLTVSLFPSLCLKSVSFSVFCKQQVLLFFLLLSVRMSVSCQLTLTKTTSQRLNELPLNQTETLRMIFFLGLLLENLY